MYDSFSLMFCIISNIYRIWCIFHMQYIYNKTFYVFVLEMDSVKCNICNKSFTRRDNLLRHIKTAHNAKSYVCTICNNNFSRPDVLHRHLKTHNTSLPQMPLMKNVPSTSYTKTTYKSCNWCHQNKILLPRKFFCADCAHQGKECNSCHRPVPPHLYTDNQSHCNACFKKIQKGGGTVSLNGIVNTTTLIPSSNWDLLEMFKDEES